ncbi:hypothetical protein HDE74_004902 [Janthinobacterium sp. K2Li3]|nr:hypothetical protein [Janthinobacterium sp. K2C7]MBB5384125.1 hypothetical protein [Janthinobacterium sp. K2Li3]MBB5389415.1 hypothetical protein [Janthinobacterium sp. K2E3]
MNLLRSACFGRSNYLFAGADGEDERAAAIYSLIDTAIQL